MMTMRILPACLACAILCGCRTAGTRHSANLDSPKSDVAAVSSTRPKAIRSDESPPDRSIQSVSHEAPSGESMQPQVLAPVDLSLSNSIGLGLSQNPDLIAARQAEHVGAAALGVAQTYPFNPFIQLQATPYQDARFGGPGTTYHYVLLMQTIQLAHQQQFREESGAATLNSTRWNIHQAELLNVAQTERLYFGVLYLRGLWELAQANNENNQQLLRVLEKQLEAGQATAADVAMVRVDARSTQQQVRLARANYETALRDFKRQLGLTADDPATVGGDLQDFAWRLPGRVSLVPKSVESEIELDNPGEREKYLIASRANSRPDVMAAHSDIDVARANLCLATAAKTPDLQIGPYYQRTLDGTSFLGFRAQMDLPVVNTGRPLEQQRIAELTQRLTVWQQASRRAELEAQAAWERYKLAVEAISEDVESSGEDLPRELQQLEQQFIAGEVDILRVIQARTSILQNLRLHLDLLNELAQAAANLTAATGMPIEELLQQ